MEILYNLKPNNGKPDCRSWKTKNGHINRSKELRSCLYRQLFLTPSSSCASIYIYPELTENEIEDLWSSVTRGLRLRGIIGLWVREITTTNKVHYHLVCTSGHNPKQLKTAIEASFPRRFRTPKKAFRICSKFYPKAWDIATYVTKAPKMDGSGRDINAPKRICFVEDCKLQKTNSLGRFWNTKTKKELWQDVITRERKVSRVFPDIVGRSWDIFLEIDGLLDIPTIQAELKRQKTEYRREVASHV